MTVVSVVTPAGVVPGHLATPEGDGPFPLILQLDPTFVGLQQFAFSAGFVSEHAAAGDWPAGSLPDYLRPRVEVVDQVKSPLMATLGLKKFRFPAFSVPPLTVSGPVPKGLLVTPPSAAKTADAVE